MYCSLLYFDICVGIECAVVFADVEVTAAWQRGKFTDTVGHVFRDIADMVAVFSEHLDGVGVVRVVGFCLQGADVLTEVVGALIALILWPYADVVAFVFNAEVLEFMNGWLFALLWQRVAVVIQQVEIGRLPW